MLVDYRCKGCGAVEEASVASPPPPERPCPECGATARRLFGSFSQPGKAKKGATERLDRERATRTPSTGGHSHDHHGHGHSHGPGGHTH